jgi:hypothetical protein
MEAEQIIDAARELASPPPTSPAEKTYGVTPQVGPKATWGKLRPKDCTIEQLFAIVIEVARCVWQLLLGHFGGLIWPTLGRCSLGKVFASPSRKNKDRRRSCGNVGIPLLLRDFQGRWEEWETVLGFSTLSTARHFHS